MSADPTQPPTTGENAPQDRQGSGPAGAPEDPLDRLLAVARWAEPPAASDQRLRAFWASVSPAGRHAGGLRFAGWSRWAAAAAVLALAAGAVWLIGSRQHRHREPEIATPVQPGSGGAERDSKWIPAQAAVAYRPPTSHERLIMARADSQFRTKQRHALLVELVDAAVNHVVADPAINPAKVVAELTRAVPRDVVTGRLTTLARTGLGSKRPAAARLLGELRLSGTLPVFLELARDPATKDVAYPAIIALADDATLARLAQAEANTRHRRQLLATLVRRGRPQATVAYLRRVADPQAAAAALDALDDVKDPPVDLLFARLGDSDASIRFAAAKVLGRINGPGITRRLAHLVERDVHRREALAALLYSRGPEAAQYLDAARQYPELSAAIESVRIQTGRSF